VIFLFDLIAFLVVLIVPGYLVADRYFQGLEKAVLSVFLSLSITSFFYYILVSFYQISIELIYFYALILLVIFFVVKKPKFETVLISIKKIKFGSLPIQRENLLNLFILFILILIFSLMAFSIPLNKIIAYDDASYHLPIILNIADDGQKTFFSETHNIYQVRSNQFPLLFESFTGATKFLLKNDFFWLISFFSLILSLFLIYFISKETGQNQIFSSILYAFSPLVILFSRYFYVDTFLSMFFLGAVFFVLKYVKDNNLLFVLVAGFLSGLMFLTKFTGGIFFAGLFLFLLYKKKFKALVFFALIFVLVSLVFVVSHLGVPVEQASVGSYGSFSSNPFFQIPLNIFRVAEVFFIFFSNNFFIFFIPLLFVLGLFWEKKKTDFSVLFFISLILFLGIIFVNQAYPTTSGFPRYFLPVYSLLCIFSGIQFKKIVLLKDKRISVFASSLFVLFMLFTSVSILSEFSVVPSANVLPSEANKIENSFDTKVWFINGAALVINLDKATCFDYSWKTDFSGEPCDFLKKHKINYIVHFHIDKLPDLGDFGIQLKESLDKNECSEVISVSRGSLNSATYRIIHSK